MDLYTVLGVTRTASADELKAAFRKKALQYHPDRQVQVWLFAKHRTGLIQAQPENTSPKFEQ